MKACATGDQGQAECSRSGMHRQRPTRLKDFPYVGKYHYSLRFTTRGRRRVFESSDLALAAIDQIQTTCATERFVAIAYCVMPDHVHIVVKGVADTSNLRRCVRLIKQRIEYVARRRFRVRGLWQDGYYDRVLRSHHAIETAVRYVLENPVRARLARRAGEYPFADASHPFRQISHP